MPGESADVDLQADCIQTGYLLLHRREPFLRP